MLQNFTFQKTHLNNTAKLMTKIKLLLLVLFVSINLLYAQIPTGYYDPAIGLTGTALQLALHNIIKGHTVKTYDYLWTAFQTTDKKANGKVWDMYSDVPGGTPPYEYTFITDQCGNYSGESSCYNREHSFPKSWFGDASPMVSDLFHIVPTDGYVNGKRSNFPYGKVGNASWTSQNGSKLGNCISPGYTSTVFEPIDDYKGDFARNYFYMAVRYYTEDSSWPGSDMVIGSQPKPWALAMLKLWSQQDPVSAKETSRNNAVYAIQHNRNPFIDNPEYITAIWGVNTGIVEPYDRLVSVSVYPNPVGNSCQIDIVGLENGTKAVLIVYDITGRREPVEVSQSGEHFVMNTTTLIPGIYVLCISDASGMIKARSRIVK